MKITENWVNVSHSIGVPFGGIGTGYGVFGKFGFVLPEFDSTPCVGKYDDFNRIENYDYLTLHGKDNKNFLTLIFQSEDAEYAIQGETTDNTTEKTADEFTSYEFLPFGQHRAMFYELGLEAELLTYSPLIPYDISESSIPVFCMEIRLKNNSENDIDGNLLFKIKNSNISKMEMFAVFEDKSSRHRVSLKSGENVCIHGFLAWYYPNFKSPSAVMTEQYTRYYTLRFDSAKAVIDYALEKHMEWKEQMLKWQDSFDVPAPFKRLWFSSLSSVITSTMMSDKPLFLEIESPHPYMNTMDVTIYSAWLYMVNWPEIEKMDMYTYRDKIPKEGEDKGLVWHSLWSDKSDYVEEPCYITRIYRDYLWFNDKKFLEDMERPVSDALNRIYSQKAVDGLVESKHGNQSYDLWKMPGIGAYVNTPWLYALYSVIKMNKVLGTDIKPCKNDTKSVLKTAADNFVKYLWNDQEKYFNCFYRTENSLEASIPESVFTDQMFGRWLLLIERNLESILPMDMIKQSTEYVYKNNLIDDKENDFRGWSNGKLPNGVPYYDNKQYHAKTCWICSQLDLGSVMGEMGYEKESLDIFYSLEHSLHNNHLAVGEWNHAITEDGNSCTLPEEPSKDTPRFPPYPRYKCCWEYLIRILGLKVDEKYMELKPFKSFDFRINNVILAGCTLTVSVKKDWNKIYVDGYGCSKAVFERDGNHNIEFK